MLNINSVHKSSLIKNCIKEIDEKKITIIKMDDYLQNMLGEASGRNEISYPYTINVPRDIDYMLRTGDLSPEKTIVIEEPYMYEGKPIWTKNSSKRIDLGFGYKNGDKRYLSEFALGDNSDTSGPHMVIGGTSGGGKSVCVNNLLFNILMGYSPFEVNLYMIDAKIAEFKRYATTHHCPHIKVIGATSDTSYVISLLQQLNILMIKLNKLFGSVGVNNINDFRKNTGLTLPRIIVIVDEYQLQYELATSKEGDLLTSQYNQFCTAGRSAGIHLVLCSQSFLSELKSKLFHNIRLRACLTCDIKTSEGILGNPVASKAVPIGQLHINIAADQSVEATTMFKVPYQNDEAFERHGKFLESVAVELENKNDFKFNTNFYDEDYILDAEDYNKLIANYTQRDRIVFGTPSFVKDKEIDVHYLDQTFEDLENIAVYSPQLLDVKEFIHMFNENFKKFSPINTKCIYLVADKTMMKDVKIPSYAMKFDIDKTTDPIYTSFISTIFKKNVMLETDELIFAGNKVLDAEVVTYMKQRYGDDSPYCNQLNFARMSHYVKKLDDETYHKINGGRLDKKMIRIHAIDVLETLISFSQEFLNKKVDYDNIPTHYFNIVGYDKFRGLYRDSKASITDLFKNLMYDTYKSKCCVILYSTNAASFSPIKDTFGRVLVSNAGEVGTKLGVELPKSLPDTLALIINPSSGHSARFKRLNMYDRSV